MAKKYETGDEVFVEIYNQKGRIITVLNKKTAYGDDLYDVLLDDLSIHTFSSNFFGEKAELDTYISNLSNGSQLNIDCGLAVSSEIKKQQ